LDIHGGTKAGYRAWTHKQNFPRDPSGNWRVEVITDGGQTLGVLRFRVDP
jgi:subtilisin-like proprotein convertase family protein